MNEIFGESAAGWFGSGVGDAGVTFTNVSDDALNAGAACTTPHANSRPATSAIMGKLILNGNDIIFPCTA